MISAKTRMIYQIMGDTMTADIIIEIEIYIKLFLSSYVRFENILRRRVGNSHRGLLHLILFAYSTYRI